MSAIDINGTSIHYVDEGPRGAHAVVMSPSLWFDTRQFDAQAAALSDRYRVVRFDYRGQGQSLRAPGDEVDMDTLADDAAALIEALDLGQVTFVGQSMGSFLGLRLAARRHDLIASAVLMGVSAEAEAFREAADGLADAIREQGVEPVVEPLLQFALGETTRTDPARAHIVTGVTELLRSRTPDYADAVTSLSHRLSVVDELKNIVAPITVVYGDEDFTYPIDKARLVVDAVPSATLEIMEKTGHCHSLENPTAVIDVIERHLAALGKTSR